MGIYTEEGARTLATEGKNFALDTRKGSYQGSRRVDIEERYAMMQPYLSTGDSSLLDIGCAEGKLTTKFSQKGLFSVGLDTSVTRTSTARTKRESTDGPGFMLSEITPDNVGKIPSFDVILLLTVYHHWCDAYGWNDAEAMLRTLAEKCDKLFFEPPGRKLDRPAFDGSDVESIDEYYTAYLNHVFDDTVDIEYIGTTPYQGGERQDPLYIIT